MADKWPLFGKVKIIGGFSKKFHWRGVVQIEAVFQWTEAVDWAAV